MLKKLLFSTSFFLLLTGCSIRNHYTDFSYIPVSTQKLLTKKQLTLQISDQRAIQDIGYTQNILGMKVARILPNKKVSSIIRDSLEKALLTKGITTGSSEYTLIVKINTCFTDYDPTFLYQRAVAKLSLNLNLSNKDGVSLYCKDIETKGVESPVFIYSGKNTSKALSKALSKSLEEFLNDKTFIEVFSH